MRKKASEVGDSEAKHCLALVYHPRIKPRIRESARVRSIIREKFVDGLLRKNSADVNIIPAGDVRAGEGMRNTQLITGCYFRILELVSHAVRV